MVGDNINHLKKIPANTNDSILIRFQNTWFRTIIGHFGPNFSLIVTQNAQFGIFPELLSTQDETG